MANRAAMVLHHKAIDRFRTRHYQVFYALFRALFGLLFMQHGAQKIFGIFGGNIAAPFSQMWFAGMIELFGGLLIAVGLLTSLVAAISAIEMIAAFFIAHFSLSNWVPVMNRGELSLLYFLAFLYVFANGSGRYSMDNRICVECKK